jgi:hypothetical protein
LELLLEHNNGTGDFEYSGWIVPGSMPVLPEFITITEPPTQLHTFMGYYSSRNISDRGTIRYFDENGARTWNHSLVQPVPNPIHRVAYAHFAVTKFPLVFERNGGTGGTDDMILEHSIGEGAFQNAQLPDLIVPPIRPNYDFGGYFFEREGVRFTAFNADGSRAYVDTFDSVEPVTIYALWSCDLCGELESECSCVFCETCGKLEDFCICIIATTPSSTTATTPPTTTTSTAETTATTPTETTATTPTAPTGTPLTEPTTPTEPAPVSESYIVVFNPYNGEDLVSVEVDENAPIGELPTVERFGFTFAGWFEERGYTPGDVNDDGVITVGDALQILRFLVGLSNVINENGEGSNEWNAALIVSEDRPQIGDALQILRYLVGLSSALDDLDQPLTPETQITADIMFVARWEAVARR